MNTFERFLGVGALALLFSAGVFADTLELKDGRTLRGKYLGGTQVIMRFEVDGDVQTFRVSEVSNLSFDRHSRRGDRQDDGNPPPPPPDQAGPSNQPGPNDAPPPPDQSQRPDDQRPYDQSQQSQPDDNPPPPPPPPSDQRADQRDRDGYDGNQNRDRDYDRDRNRESSRQPNYAAPGTSITVPAGQAMLVRMIDEIDSRHNVVGDVFKATLETDLVVNDTLVAHRGSDVYGRLAYAKEAGHFSGSSELQLELTRIMIDGREFPIVSGEYTLRGKGRGEDTAKKVGGGAVAGAIIGAIAGGGQGAAIGAGVGSAAGAGAQVLTRGHQVKVPSETLLEFRLDQPVTVTPTQQ